MDLSFCKLSKKHDLIFCKHEKIKKRRFNFATLKKLIKNEFDFVQA